MKDKIYTIPVTDAFRVDCECSFCELERKLEEESVDLFLGGALMEPDFRVEMNEHGFCKLHLDALFDSKKNALGLGLILTSFLDHYNQRLSKVLEKVKSSLVEDGQKSIFSRKSNVNPTEELQAFLSKARSDCTICNKLNNTMKRYISVFFYMWKTEQDFRVIFEGKKGFCSKHFQLLIEEIDASLKGKEKRDFLTKLFEQQINNLSRLQSEVKWFTEKFDYKNNDEPWGNSRDAVQRCIEKLR